MQLKINWRNQDGIKQCWNLRPSDDNNRIINTEITMTYVMYRLFKHQKKVNGEWVDDDALAPSIDGDGKRDKVISFTSNESCYNGDVTDERWVDVSIIDGECNQMPQDYDDTKQEYLGCK